MHKYNLSKLNEGDEMKVSVIIPVYNTKDYLRKCLDSLLAQTIDEIEILAVDDGSTDGTTDLLKEYADKHPERIKAFYKENGGQGSARNLALQYAKGEYLGFVDSDDWVDLDMYEKMYEKAKQDNADIVICDITDHYPTYDVYHHSSTFTDKFSVTPSACNKIFRSDVIGDIKFPEGIWYEDFEFTTKNLMCTDNISVIHKDFYHCHCREVSTMSNNNAKKNMDMLTVLSDLESFVKERGIEQKHRETLEYLYIDHVLITTINRLQRQQNKDKNGVIKAMKMAIKEKYPKFYKDEVFKRMPRNRKIVAILNYLGLSYLSKVLLDVKANQKKA